MLKVTSATLLFAAMLLPREAVHARVADEHVDRIATDKVAIAWTDKAPVDVYMSDRPDSAIADASLLARNVRKGHLETTADHRVYFLLKDTKDGTQARVAERVLPLEHGSNFRDLGGYPADGKHVRWGVLFRSGASPVLTSTDVKQIQALQLKNLVDLRSSEERALAPTRINGVRYTAVGYSMAALMPSGPPSAIANLGPLYRGLPTLLIPQLRIVFQMMLAGDVPLAYNCSAGQDRTGLTTALILSALGVPHDVVMADYHLSTRVRHPENEMPKITPATAAENPIAGYFAKAQQDPAGAVAQPLYDPDHRPLLDYAFEEIQSRWGSVENYLATNIGVSAGNIQKLRELYLE